MADTTQNLNYPVFYKPDPNSPQVYDQNGNAVDLTAYKTATGQTNVPDNEVNFQYVQSAQPPQSGTTNSASVWDLPGMAALKATLTPADQAFAQSMWQVQQQQYSSGGVGALDPQSYAKAMQIASTDPDIKSTYGDAATLAAKDLSFSIGQITNNQATGQAVLQNTLTENQKALDTQIAQAGQAYSGFRQQAQKELNENNADVIQSTRSQLQQQIQQLGSNYESTYGSGFPGTGGSSSITAGGPVTGQVTYQPVGGIIGTQNQAATNATQQTGQSLGIVPSVSSTGVLK